MNKNTDAAIIIISVIYIFFTSMLDVRASVMVAIVAVICFVLYKTIFSINMTEKSKVHIKHISKASTAKRIKKHKK